MTLCIAKWNPPRYHARITFCYASTSQGDRSFFFRVPMSAPMTHRFTHRWPTVIGIAFLLAALADCLFYKSPIGWTLGLFGTAVLLFMLVRSDGSRLWRSWHGPLAVVLTFGAMLALAGHPSTCGILMAILGLFTVALLTRQRIEPRVSRWVEQYFFLLFSLFSRPILDWFIDRRWSRRSRTTGRGIMRLFAAFAWWFFPLVAGLVFLILFSFANPIIEAWLRTAFTRVLTVFDWLPQYLGPGRVLLWVLVAGISYGLLRYRLRYHLLGHGPIRPPIAQRPISEWWFNGPQMIVRCLVVFNVVFALETILDVIYLFGGRSLPEGMDYRDYAHRGAYPLIFTALLAGLFVLWAFRVGGPAHRSAWCRRLVYLWLLQNLFLMFSTLWRVWLYVEACLLTRWRIAAMIWVGLVALGFVWIIVKIAASKPNAWLWKTNVLTLAVVFYACAFINFDRLIAQYDVTHSREHTHAPFGPIIEPMLPYVVSLGPDALPALEQLRKEDKDPGHQKYLDEVLPQLRQELKDDLKDWRGWTWRRARIAKDIQLAQ